MLATGKLQHTGFVRPGHGFFNDLVNVEVKLKVFRLGDIVQLIVVLGSAQITPLVDDQQAVPVLDGDRARKWPNGDLIKLQGCLQLEVVHRQRHLANARALALFDLVAKTRLALFHFLKAQQGLAQLVLFGDSSQVTQRFFLVAEKPVQIVLKAWLQMLVRDERGSV